MPQLVPKEIPRRAAVIAVRCRAALELRQVIRKRKWLERRTRSLRKRSGLTHPPRLTCKGVCSLLTLTQVSRWWPTSSARRITLDLVRILITPSVWTCLYRKGVRLVFAASVHSQEMVIQAFCTRVKWSYLEVIAIICHSMTCLCSTSPTSSKGKAFSLLEMSLSVMISQAQARSHQSKRLLNSHNSDKIR